MAVTGSAGKTTTSTLLAAVLGSRGPAVGGPVVSNANSLRRLCRTVMAARKEHEYGIVEASVGGRGDMAVMMSAVRPDIGIVTTIGSDHRAIFRNLENTAREKSEVVRCLRDSGTAILNTDDPLVWAMREATRARVIGCGRSQEATLRLESASAQWPNRLVVKARYGGDLIEIPTRFLGEYAVFPVLAAAAAGISQGMSPTEVCESIAKVEPVDGRMKPHETPDGVWFVDNGWKSPYYIIPTVLDFLRQATAPRKIVVFGEISDYSNSTGHRYRLIARDALQVADIVIFSGPWAASVTKVSVPAGKTLLAFPSTSVTRDRLRPMLRSGDLVVLQGSQSVDHFERLILDRTIKVECWADNCRKLLRCRACNRLTKPPLEKSPERQVAVA